LKKMETTAAPRWVRVRPLSQLLAPAFGGVRVLLRWLAQRASGKRKALSVTATAALGDRRFVSVIQFEEQRFLIGSSPASVTLLSQLPDAPADSHEAQKKKNAGENN
jgi:flagellar biogenesis protein FliO